MNYTTVTYTIKNTFIFRKNDFIRSLEKDWYQYRSDTTWWENIFYFQDNWKWSTGKHTEKTEICCKIVKLARPFGKKKIPMFRNTLLRIYFSSKFGFGHEIFAFWETYRWTSRAFWTSNTTCNQKYCCQQICVTLRISSRLDNSKDWGCIEQRAPWRTWTEFLGKKK